MTLALYGLFKMGQLSESLNILLGDMKRENERLNADLNRLVELAGQLVVQTNQLNQMVDEKLGVTFWHVTTPNWSKIVDLKEEADQLVQKAKDEGIKWYDITCTRHFKRDKAFIDSFKTT